MTSHLSGLFYRTSNLIQKDIKVIYVFDGTPPVLKEAEIKRRMRAKEEAVIKYEWALQKGDLQEARIHAQASSKIKNYMTSDAKTLLTLMGVPWIQAPSEGEAQAAYLVKRGDSTYCASQDYDSLLFGTPYLARNMTVTGRRKLPRKKAYVEVHPEIVNLKNTLNKLGITYEQLVDIGILVGTDFNPEGVKGVGPKTALKLIKQYGCIEELILRQKKIRLPVELQQIREIFLHPKITNDYIIEHKEPDIEGVVDFLCYQKDFSEERVLKNLNNMLESVREFKKKRTLESWF